MSLQLHIHDAVAEVHANQFGIFEAPGPELAVDTPEDLVKGADGVGVQPAHLLDLLRIIVIQRHMVHVLADHLQAVAGVDGTEQHVRMPEAVDGGRNGVAVCRIEDGNGVVLLQGKDAAFEVFVAGSLTTLHGFQSRLLADRRKVDRVQEANTPQMFGAGDGVRQGVTHLVLHADRGHRGGDLGPSLGHFISPEKGRLTLVTCT